MSSLAKVCGINATEKEVLLTSTKVKLTPSIVTDLCLLHLQQQRLRRRNETGRSKDTSSCRNETSRSIDMTSDVMPSKPIAHGQGSFDITSASSCNLPKLVRESVSSPASTAMRLPWISITVRQHPLNATRVTEAKFAAKPGISKTNRWPEP